MAFAQLRTCHALFASVLANHGSPFRTQAYQFFNGSPCSDDRGTLQQLRKRKQSGNGRSFDRLANQQSAKDRHGHEKVHVEPQPLHGTDCFGEEIPPADQSGAQQDYSGTIEPDAEPAPSVRCVEQEYGCRAGDPQDCGHIGPPCLRCPPR